MRVILQRVSEASVQVDGECIGSIQQGLLAFVGISNKDTLAEVHKLAKKCIELRIFDENGKMQRSLQDVKGKLLSISQFTLYATCKKGRRPSFDEAASAEVANKLYEAFNEEVRRYGVEVETGKFQADMKITLTNDGPVTMILDTSSL